MKGYREGGGEEQQEDVVAAVVAEAEGSRLMVGEHRDGSECRGWALDAGQHGYSTRKREVWEACSTRGKVQSQVEGNSRGSITQTLVKGSRAQKRQVEGGRG